MGSSVQCQDRFVGLAFVVLNVQGDALAFESLRVGLDLYVLVKQAVYRLLGFVDSYVDRGTGMKRKLLFDGARQIPAEKHERVAAMALRMEKTPGFCFGCSQCVCSRFKGSDGMYDGFTIIRVYIDFIRLFRTGCFEGELGACGRNQNLSGARTK